MQTIMHFDGTTYDPQEDLDRLTGQAHSVFALIWDGEWWTLGQISQALGYPESSISARLRDLRKKRFGSHTVDRKRLDRGLWAYRVIPHE